MSATYIIKQEHRIERMEGNSGAIEFLIPSVIDITTLDLLLEVNSANNKLIIRKTNEDFVRVDEGHIRATCQIIIADTNGKSGIHYWELTAVKTTTRITLAKGQFFIIPKRSKQ